MATAEEISAASRGRWKGSMVNAGEIQTLIQARKMPAGIQWREPSAEIMPEPRAGERVVFVAHFERGFGLRIITFSGISLIFTSSSRTISRSIL